MPNSINKSVTAEAFRTPSLDGRPVGFIAYDIWGNYEVSFPLTLKQRYHILIHTTACTDASDG